MHTINLIATVKSKNNRVRDIVVPISKSDKLSVVEVEGKTVIVAKDAQSNVNYGFYSSKELEYKVVKDYCDVLNNWIPICDTLSLNLLSIFDNGAVLYL